MDWDSDDAPDEASPPPATLEEALEKLHALGQPDRIEAVVARHKLTRPALGCDLPALSDLAGAWRAGLSLSARLELAEGLWQSGLFEARILAAKLLVQARIRPDDRAVWNLIAGWVPEFDSVAIADQVARAGERRLVADPSRLDEVETWLRSDNPWVRRAALIFTLPWTRLPHPKEADLTVLTRLLGWAETIVTDPMRLVQQALALWLRELSRRHPEMTRDFLIAHGRALPIFARLEAAQLLAEPIVYAEPEAEEESEAEAEEDFDSED